MTTFVRNSWYAAAWVDEVGDAMVARRILGEPLVLFRSADEGIVALLDQCPHRLLPLSMGVVAEGRIQCGYHGIEFNGAGRCVRVPGQDMIPPTAKVRTFPVVERFDLVWVWMGDEEAADPALLPVVERYGAPGWALLDGGYQHHASNYRNIIENLMDPAHTTFVHKGTIGNPAATDEPVKVGKLDGGLVAYRWVENSPPSPFDRLVMEVTGSVDRGQFFYYYLPGTSCVDIISIPAGTEREDEVMDAKGMRAFSYKFLTPEDERNTHFFWLHLRNYRLEDEEWAAGLRANLDKTFLEDAVIVKAIQDEQDRTGLHQRTALAIDRAPVMALAMLDKMVREEGAAVAAE